MSPYARRLFKDRLVAAACLVAALLAVAPLVAVLGHIAVQGVSGMSLALVADVARPDAIDGGAATGGLAHAFAGTGLIVGIACLLGVPLGVAAGVYLAELGDGRLGQAVRFSADVLAGVPSILIGVTVYALVVIPMRGPSALAGGVALGVVMLPTVARTTEALLRLVPDSLREASLALGMPKWRAVARVVLRTAAPGVATGVLVAIARVAGETAALLFTAGDSNAMPESLTEPTASVTVKIYEYALSPSPVRHAQAWAAALVLVAVILLLNITARAIVRPRASR